MYFYNTEGTACKNDQKCRHYLVEFLDSSRNHVLCSTCCVKIPLLENTSPLEPEFLRYFMEKYEIPLTDGVIAGRPAQFNQDGFVLPADEPLTDEFVLAALCEREYFAWEKPQKISVTYDILIKFDDVFASDYPTVEFNARDKGELTFDDHISVCVDLLNRYCNQYGRPGELIRFAFEGEDLTEKIKENLVKHF